MERTLKGDFHIANLALFNARLLSELDHSEGEVKAFLRSVWGRNGLSGEPVPVNQSTFMQMSYVCLVWLWESVIKERHEEQIIRAVFDVRKLPRPNSRLGANAKGLTDRDLLRRLRNALSHGHVSMDDDRCYFNDSNPRKEGDTCEINMTWPELAALCEAVLFSVSDLLYPKSR